MTAAGIWAAAWDEASAQVGGFGGRRLPEAVVGPHGLDGLGNSGTAAGDKGRSRACEVFRPLILRGR